MTRILFVDDEPAILAGIQNLLYKDRKRWDLVFALGGEQALEHVRRVPFDVVVSDMRMPGIDGATLLNQIRIESPATVRIMLSGHAEREAIVRALPAIHQLLSKPCGAATLRAAIDRAALSEIPAAIARLIGRVDALPTPTTIHEELARRLADPTTSVSDLAAVVSVDPGLAAKVLQLVNSAYFGSGRVVGSISEAVAMLGVEQFRYIVATTPMFSVCTGCVELDALRARSQRAAELVGARAVPAVRDLGYAAALLHQVGRIVLGPEVPESALVGTTDAQVGASLLAIWGLPAEIVELVRYQRDPDRVPPELRALAAVLETAIREVAA